MKKELFSSVILSVCCLVLFAGIYPLAVWGIAQAAPNRGKGFVVESGGKYYYRNIAQKFTADAYFWSRPSAVDYNAAGSGGSNKGPANPEYLATVQGRIDSFAAHNPGIAKSDIPSDLVTASGSGLDPDISIQAAKVQAGRVAKARGMSADAVSRLIDKHTAHPLLGPAHINVLELNLDLDKTAKK